MQSNTISFGLQKSKNYYRASAISIVSKSWQVDKKKKIEFNHQGYRHPINENFILAKQNGFFCILTDLTQDLEEFIENIKSKFQGISFSFFESIGILKAVFGNQNKSGKVKILILYTETNHMVLVEANKDGIPISLKEMELVHSTPASTAGEIMQKIEDKSCSTKNPIEFAVVAPKEMGKIISKEQNYQNIILLTPYELAILLDVEFFFSEDERFCDLLFAHNLIAGKKTKAVLPKIQKQLFLHDRYNKIANYSILSAFLAILLSKFFLTTVLAHTQKKHKLHRKICNMQ